MKPAFFKPTKTLKQRDFFLLEDVFRQVIKDLLPIEATVLFWCRQWKQKKKYVYTGKVKNWQGQLEIQCNTLEPGFILGMLAFPLVLDDRSIVAVLVKDIDPALAEKMDYEWLRELRASIQENLEIKRQEYADGVTGLYSNNLLTTFLKQDDQVKFGVLFLVGIGNRTRKLTFNLMKTVQAGHFIESISSGAVFYLGGNLFAVLHGEMTRQESQKLARRLLSRLKREGMHSVHIGISQLEADNEEDNRESALSECWQALEAAELRGPFSLCEASVYLNRGKHPLARPPVEVIAQLRKSWRGLKQFGLILVIMDNTEIREAEDCDLTKIILPLLPEDATLVPVSSHEIFILVPERSKKQTLQTCKKIRKGLDNRDFSPSCSMGVCHWPTLNYTKTEMSVNCRKAIMHGSFFGSGSVTTFDYVSLNVSGDYYFDEGDYRQAVRDYRIGCRMAPEDVNLLNSLGVALIELNRLREAIGYFDKVLEIKPDNFMALVNKGLALRIVGNDAEALRCLEHASQGKEFNRADVFEDISLQLGRLYCDNGSYNKAVRVLEQLTEQKTMKQELGFIRLSGEAYAGTGENRKAIKLLQRAVRMYPHDAKSLSILGELYALEHQGDEIALSLCEQAVEIDESPWRYWYRLAIVLNKMGKSHEALDALQKCLRRNRKTIEALTLAGEIYEQLGEQKKSERMFQRVNLIASKQE